MLRERREVLPLKCDPKVAVYWSTDYPSASDASRLDLKMSIHSVRRYAPRVPRIVFSLNPAEDTLAWEANRAPLPETFDDVEGLRCERTFVAEVEAPDDDLKALMVSLLGSRTAVKGGGDYVKRGDLVEHAAANNFRFYVFDRLFALGVEAALYLDVDAFFVANCDALFATLLSMNETFAVASPPANQPKVVRSTLAKPYANTSVATRLNYSDADVFNAGVVGVNVRRARDADVPRRLAEIYRIHLYGERLWNYKSVNQACVILVAKALGARFVDPSFNCKYGVNASEVAECRILHHKSKHWPVLARVESQPVSRCGSTRAFRNKFSKTLPLRSSGNYREPSNRPVPTKPREMRSI